MSVITAERIERYGKTWSTNSNDLEIELASFREGRTVEQGGLGKAKHFEQCVKMLWPNIKGVIRPCIWHPWLTKMTDAACQYSFLAISGCASSGKSDFGAIWSIVNFLSSPWLTTILVTSTTVEQSKLRIWGRICEYWTSLGNNLPGRMLEKKIKLNQKWWLSHTGSENTPEVPGIELIAAEKSQTHQAIQKLIGIKAASYGGQQGRLILIADELPDLSPSILTASMSNLISNKDFQLIALGNHKSDLDAFGQFSRPKNGWDSVSVDHEQWETDRGICLHLDAMKSPNWIAGEDKYPIISINTIKDALKNLGPGKSEFWRMIRSFPCPIADDNKIYSECDLRNHNVCSKPEFDGNVIKLGGLDPSWTSGGDRCIFAVIQFGSVNGSPTIYWDKYYSFQEDPSKGHRGMQIAKWAQDICIQEGIHQKYLAVDATGGIIFCDILEDVIGRGIYRVFFYGAATDRPVSVYQPGPAKEYYFNRVSEIWHVGQSFVNSEQLKINPNIYDEVAREMTLREVLKDKPGRRTQIQSKKDMKILGFSSPDIADAFFIGTDLAREKFSFTSGGSDLIRDIYRRKSNQRRKEFDSIYNRKKAYGLK